MTVTVFPNADLLAAGAAQLLASRIREWSGDVVTLGLAGGSTPKATYAELTRLEIPWDRVHAWIGDERFVAPDDPDNNGSMARRELLDAVEAPASLVPWRDGAAPDAIAAEYERTLLGVFDNDGTGPRPDLILAGIGDDGHTLSLFPGTAALDVTDRWFVANWVEKFDAWRLTATYPLAHRARLIVVLAAGEGKAAALSKILEPTTADRLPAARLMDGGAPVDWLVDEAAASLLASTPIERA